MTPTYDKRTDRPELWEYIRHLEEEVARLKSGRFTEEELQALCHEQGEDCPERFARGCLEYNRKLFGEKCRVSLTEGSEQ